MSDAVITYGWNRVAYNVLRSLSNKGLNVAVGDESRLAMSKRSRYCSSSFYHPSFYAHPQGFIKSLKTNLKLLRPKVYIPVYEEIMVVAKHIKEFSDLDVKIPIHDFESLKSVFQKDSLYKIAKELDIPMPKTFKPKDHSELRGIWEELKDKGKGVIKLINSNSATGVFYFNSYNELSEKFSKAVKRNNLAVKDYPLIQEYVDGDGYGVSMLFNHGSPRARFTHKRLREKIATGSTSTKRISVKNPVIEKYAQALLSSLGWHGVAMVEFKYNEKEKKAWLIEVNPRFWGSLSLAIESGVDFPYLLYKMAVEKDIEPVFEYSEGVVSRWLLGDMLAVLNYVKSRRSLSMVKDFFSFKNERFDDLYLDDLTPFFTECAYYFSRMAKRIGFSRAENELIDIDRI